MDTKCYVLTSKEFMKTGFEFADLNCLRPGLNEEKKLAGKD
jgi:hypothetical protein